MHVDFLYELSTKQYAEYRDTQYESIGDLRKQMMPDPLTDERLESFKRRNSNGTFFLLEALFKYNFIEMHEDAWHFTVVITDLGKEFLEQNTYFLEYRRCVKCKKDYVNYLCSCGEQDNYEYYKKLIHNNEQNSIILF